METKYLCPHCENALNVDNDIVLKAKNNIGEKGLVFLHTDLGNYQSKFSIDFIVLEGEKVKFFCPLCNHNLTSLKNERLAHFIMVDADEKRFKIVFSQVFGERCTYVINECDDIQSYGDHLHLYLDPEWFLYK